MKSGFFFSPLYKKKRNNGLKFIKPSNKKYTCKFKECSEHQLPFLSRLIDGALVL